MSNKVNVFESAIIIFVGMFMHLYRISIIELRYSRLLLLTPNAASSLFVFSVLSTFAKLRPLWPQTLRMPQKFLIFLVELALILCATDFILRQVWLPTLRLLNFICNYLAHYVLAANQGFIIYNAPEFSNWIRNDAFYIARFTLAVTSFIFMIDSTGMMQVLKAKNFVNIKKLETICPDVIQTSDNKMQEFNQNVSPLRSVPFDVYQLPCVPQEDIIIMAHRAVRRRMGRRKRKLLLKDDEESNEFNC